MRAVAESVSNRTKIVNRFEQVVETHKDIPQNNLQALHQQHIAFKVLRDEVPAQNPKFQGQDAEINDAVNARNNLADVIGDGVDDEVPQLKEASDNVNKRWGNVKDVLEQKIAFLDQLIPEAEKGKLFSKLFVIFFFWVINNAAYFTEVVILYSTHK